MAEWLATGVADGAFEPGVLTARLIPTMPVR
jgi:hypothetical protein